MFPIKAFKVAEIIEAELLGNPEGNIYALDRIEDLKTGELSFIADSKFEKYVVDKENVFLIVNKNFNAKLHESVTLFKVDNPHFALEKLLHFIDSKSETKSNFIHNTCVIEETAEIAKSAYIGPRCIIGKNCIIGENVILHSNVVLYDNVSIDNNTILHSGVICCNDTKIGRNCIFQPGAIIGSDGFGYHENKDGSYEKIPQLGNVIIEDNVEIGANTTVDRAIVGSTIIGKGVKIDNLCQIAHNVKIGENTAMAAHVGIAGSTSLGKRNRLGGQVGLAGHLETADDVVIYAQSGVAKSIERKGIYFGSPIKDRLLAFKIEAALGSLPELVKTVERMRKKLED
jgi:UDP-3-O-[3-hydroxymyristoyl] glucosamine N-acyltransferase